ncbi:MAG: GGDEF domain-containing protein [Nakamurella sp.]
MTGSGARILVTRWITVDDSPSASRLRGRVSGVLFVVGTILVLIAMRGQPEWAQMNRTAVYVSSAIFVLAGLIQTAIGARVPAIVGYPILSFAIVGTAYAQVMTDPATTSGQAVAMPYLWIVVVAAMYCTVAATALQVLLVGAAYGAALAVTHTEVWLPQWIMVFGTCIVVAAVVGGLSHELRQRAYTDVLTGVANRRSLMLRLGQEIDNATRRGTQLAVLLIDLDKFKELNDAHGHAAGDAALVDCARAWQAELRSDDFLARLGGDEFFAVLPRCDNTASRKIAERMLAALSGLAIPLACSIGMTEFRTGDTADTLLHRTDQAMYVGKGAGGNSVIHADAPPDR